ncbi:MAG TPA: PIN domain-containing protein [Cyclobacteriaceae bacterium]|nr:PIN domain-containing protein [Cyclobacteriaceae bacterium]
MNVFLDANILVSVLNKEFPLFSFTSRILSLDPKRFKLFTSPICLAIAFYFAEKKSGTKLAKSKIQLLVQHIEIADANKDGVLLAAQNNSIDDFEDGLEYYAALHVGCSCIVTENVKDFYFSEIEVLNAERFLEKYVL